MSPSYFSLFVLSSVCVQRAAANAFLGRDLQSASMHGAPLLEQLEQVLGSDHRAATESRVIRVENALRASYAAMPKNAHGSLGYDAVRYMVHRYFVERHGWFVRGLDAAGEAWNSSSPAAIFKEHAGQNETNLFEEGSKGFSLNQVAIFTATLEGFVHTENLARLHAAYRFSGVSSDSGSVTQDQVEMVMETYMMFFVLGVNHTEVTHVDVRKHRDSIEELYPTWVETTKWIRQVRQEVLGDAGATTFDATVQVLEEIGDRYGRWQNSECLDLKNSLLKMEVPGTGRVRLDAFYQSALDGNWQFTESVAYLRQLGALDESDSQRPSIMVPNYVNSPSNCVAASSFYSVCCIDECESLLSHLELEVSAPEATPARILDLVAALPSATTQAPRKLPAVLVQRLEDIAKQHGGVVPFHGRLFAQWMHHVYPRECQYPHLSGTTNPLAPEEWAQQTGEEISASEEAMRQHVEEASRTPKSARLVAVEDELPWVEDEELFVNRVEVPQLSGQGLCSACRGIAILGAIFSIALKFVQAAHPVKCVLSGGEKMKYAHCV